MMRTRRFPRPAALIPAAALALALAACSDGSGSDGPTEDSEPPEVKVSVPDQFDDDSPAWETISEIQGGAHTALSPDSKHLAYAYSTEEGGEFVVGQVDLESGESSEETSVEALSSGDAGSSGRDAGLMYSGNRLVLLQQGVPQDTSAKQWSAAVFPVGRGGSPKVIAQKLEDSAAEVELPNASAGPLVKVTSQGSSTYHALDADSSDISVVDTEPSAPITGCGGESCDLQLNPVAQVGRDTVSTFQESKPGGSRVCSRRVLDSSPDADGFDKCLRGFSAGGWSSQDSDIAPKGAVPESAHLYAVGHEHLVGAWKAKGGGTVYRTINVRDPRRSHVEVRCDQPTNGNATHAMSMSASGKYMVAGSVRFDVNEGTGACFEEDGGTADVGLVSVDNAGTAWGTTSQSGPESYTDEVVSAKTDGPITPAEGDVAVPWAFLQLRGQEVAVFVNSGDAEDGATVVAAYPKAGS